MKKLIVRTLAITLALSLLCGSAALGESKYVSIKDIRDTIPERWTGEYTIKKGAHNQLKKGDTVSIDVPIVVPEVDTVPVVRITWNGPAKDVDQSLEVTENTRDYLAIVAGGYNGSPRVYDRMADGTVFDSSLPWDHAPDIAINRLRQFIPSLKDTQLTCYDQAAVGASETEGECWLNFYSAFHGIPYLVDDAFRLGAEGERDANQAEGESTVPLSRVFIVLKTADRFWATISIPKEVGVDVEDIPLLPFDEIQKAFEQRIADGYVYSLNEVRFGYMVFIDPEKKGEEYVLIPVWAAKGRTNGDPTIPFDLKTSDEVIDCAGYSAHDIIVINAQTGEPYDTCYNTRPNRRYVPKIITWDDMK